MHVRDGGTIGRLKHLLQDDNAGDVDCPLYRNLSLLER